jgi:hypothetical protein
MTGRMRRLVDRGNDESHDRVTEAEGRQTEPLSKIQDNRGERKLRKMREGEKGRVSAG